MPDYKIKQGYGCRPPVFKIIIAKCITIPYKSTSVNWFIQAGYKVADILVGMSTVTIEVVFKDRPG